MPGLFACAGNSDTTLKISCIYVFGVNRLLIKYFDQYAHYITL